MWRWSCGLRFEWFWFEGASNRLLLNEEEEIGKQLFGNGGSHDLVNERRGRIVRWKEGN